MATVTPRTQDTLSGIAKGDLEMLGEAVTMRGEYREATGLDARTYALVKIASLIALDAPPSSYVWQITNALEEGASAEDVLGVLLAVAPQVGGPRVVAAAPEVMLALGLALPDAES